MDASAIRIGFVGPDSRKWIFDGLTKAEKRITEILQSYILLYPNKKIIVISGGCPVGTKRYYCAHCDSFIYGRSLDIHLGSLEPEYRTIEIYDEGGIDTLAEIVAFKLGLETDIKRPDVKQLNDEVVLAQGREITTDQTLLGYRSRNIQIAEVCTVLFCIVPKVRLPIGFDITKPETLSKKFVCYHCHKVGHPTNGGCWTMYYAQGIGKPTYLIIIE